MLSGDQKKEARSFGFLIGGAFLFFGFWPLARHGLRPSFVLMALGGLFFALSFLWPSLFYYPRQLWMKIGHVLMLINSTAILCVLFFAVITPLGVLMRLCGKRPLSLKYDNASRSYWMERRVPLGTMARQF